MRLSGEGMSLSRFYAMSKTQGVEVECVEEAGVTDVIEHFLGVNKQVDSG